MFSFLETIINFVFFFYFRVCRKLPESPTIDSDAPFEIKKPKLVRNSLNSGQNDRRNQKIYSTPSNNFNHKLSCIQEVEKSENASENQSIRPDKEEASIMDKSAEQIDEEEVVSMQIPIISLPAQTPPQTPPPLSLDGSLRSELNEYRQSMLDSIHRMDTFIDQVISNSVVDYSSRNISSNNHLDDEEQQQQQQHYLNNNSEFENDATMDNQEFDHNHNHKHIQLEQKTSF